MNSLSQKYLFIIIILLTLIGIGLRCVFIDLPLWYDEAHSVLIAKMAFPFGINNYLMNVDLQHTPFYFYILHFWVKIFGESDIILKLLSLIFAVFSIPAIYVLSKKLTNDKFALIPPLLLTFNTFHIIYSTEVRMYSLIMLLSILSVNYLCEYLNNDSNKTLVKLSFINFLMPYTFTGSIIFVLSEIISVLLVFAKCRNLKKYLISNFLLFFTLIPYFIMIFVYYLKRSEFLLSHVTDFSLANIFGLFQNFLAPFCGAIFWATLNPFYLNFQTLIFVFIPVFVSVYLIYTAVKKSDKIILLISLITFFTFLNFTFFAINKTIVLAPRYLIFVLPLMLILVGLGLTKLKKSLIILFLLYYCITSSYFVYTDKLIPQLKKSALMTSINYINRFGLDNKDMVIMPFASSVISHYTDKNYPEIPRFEAIQELRIYNNKNIYSDDIIKRFETEKISDVFRDIILSDNYISENFHNYILNTYVNPIEKNHYILFVISEADSQVLTTKKELIEVIKDDKYFDENVLTYILAKCFIDIHKIIQEKAILKDTKIIDNNVYFLYQKT